MKHRIYIATIIIMSIYISLFSPLTASSLDERSYMSNSIYFLNKKEAASCVETQSQEAPVATTTSGPTTQAQSQLPAETIKKLDALGVKEKFKQNSAAYAKGEAATGVPATMLAALHFREGGMDPTRSIADGEKLGKGWSVDGVRIGNTLEEDAILAAKHFQEMAKSVYGITINKSMKTEDKGRAFLAYNRGFLYKRAGLDYDKSGYVMQGIDSEHIGGSWRFLDPFGGHSQAGRLTNGNPGALAVLAYLGDSTTTTSCEPAAFPGNFAAYSQCEGPWSSLPYSSHNFCTSACGVVSAAMILTTLKKQSITPDSIVANVRKYGGEIIGVGSNTNNIQKMMQQEYGLRGENIDVESGGASGRKDRINAALDRGAIIYTSGRGSRPFTSGGHVIAIYKKLDDNRWLVGDPAGSTKDGANRKVLGEYNQDDVAKYIHLHIGALYAK